MERHVLRMEQGKPTSTTTSLLPRKCGNVAACTGVMRLNPMVDTPSKIHCASGGVRASQALGSFFATTFPGAILVDLLITPALMEGRDTKSRQDKKIIILSARVMLIDKNVTLAPWQIREAARALGPTRRSHGLSQVKLKGQTRQGMAFRLVTVEKN